MPDDFRYSTGKAAVPWPAIGEPYGGRDAAALLKFMFRPGDKRPAYSEALKNAQRAVKRLAEVSEPAAKLSTGTHVAALEKTIGRYLNAKYTLFCTNWTAGSEIACHFAGIKPGDEVIVPAITFFATATHPLSMGAKLVLADVDPRTLNMDPQDVARKITKRTRAIVPVHLGGYPVDMDPIMKLARRHAVTVIEDGAHAFGAAYKGRMIGTIGHFGAFSFHEVKNITAFGEGGILVTNLPYGKDFAKARFIGFDATRQIKNWLYDVVALKGKGGYFPGRMCTVTEIQALGLQLQFNRVNKVIAARRKAAEYLSRRFQGVPGLIPQLLDTKDVKASYHLYLLQVDPAVAGADVQALKRELDSRGVTQIPHFAPLYKFSALRQLGYDTKQMERSCPVAEEAFQHRFTHLPLYGISREQLVYMADAVVGAVERIGLRRKGTKRR